MSSNILQLLLVLFLGSVATYDKVMSKRKNKKGEGKNPGEALNYKAN